MEPEKEVAPPKVKDWSRHGLDQYAAKERALLEREDLSAKGKKQLQAFLRMERVTEAAKAEGYDMGNIARRIDGKGVVIFTLESGGSVRDTGRELFYSLNDEKAHGVALAYAALKWGKNIMQEHGRIVFQQTEHHRARRRKRENERGWSL